jgi:hypothetical protein
VASACAGNAVPDAEPADSASDLDDRSCGAVPDRRLLVELAFDCFTGRSQALLLGSTYDLAHEIRALARLGEK